MLEETLRTIYVVHGWYFNIIKVYMYSIYIGVTKKFKYTVYTVS